MAGSCREKDCIAPVACHDGCDDYKKCPNWLAENAELDKSLDNNINESNLRWSGGSLSINELNPIASRNSPIVIGIIGKADAGKTTFLGMLYTLLLNGRKFDKYKFAGSRTLLGWDELYFNLTFNKSSVAFPSPTPAGKNSLYHFALKNSNNRLVDILFSDASGESFYYWSQNRNDENAENARWIYQNSDCFIFFIDCESLADGLNGAKNEIFDIAMQMTLDLQSRPVIAVWSKADKKGNVPTEIQKAIHEKLVSIFPIFYEIEISNLLDPGPDELVHKHNLQVVDWLLEQVSNRITPPLVPKKDPVNDFFLNFTRHE